MPHETLDDLLTDDAVLPEQIADIYNQRPKMSGVLLLHQAVLADAIDVLSNRVYRADGKEFLADVAWVNSDDTEWPFSFLPVCEALDLDPQSLRMQIAARIARRNEGPRPKSVYRSTCHRSLGVTPKAA